MAMVDPVNGEAAPTVYAYDVNDRKTMVVAPNGATTTYEYDDLGNLIAEHSPDRGTVLYAYDAAGNRICSADGRYTDGYSRCQDVPERWIYTYDALNRLTSIDYQSSPEAVPDVVYDYDAVGELGRLDQMSRESSGGEIVETQFDYDLFGNLIARRQFVPDSPVAPAPFTTAYRYDAAGGLVQVRYPSGRIVDYQRDAQGRVIAVQAVSPLDTSVTTIVSHVRYEPFGPPRSIVLGNGLVSTREFDAAWRVTGTGLANAQGAVDYHVYLRDGVGNLLQDLDILDPASNRSYRYDALDRLIDDSFVDDDPAVDTYVYDPNGNRLRRNSNRAGWPAQAIAHDTANASPNRIVSINARVVRHDGAGNRVQDDATGRSITMDASNRLSTLYAGGSQLQALYNGAGELARTVTVPDCPCGGCASWTEYFRFLPDGRPLGLTQHSNARIEWDWIWLDGIPVAQFQDSYMADGTPIGTQLTWLHADSLGTPRTGTNHLGTVTWKYLSDAFGKAQILGGTTTVRLRMPGQVDYGVGGIYYNGLRDYDPDTGRYLESDPVGLEGGLNPFAYADLNPLRWIDPTGTVAGTAAILSIDTDGQPFGNTCGSGWLARYIPDGPWKAACEKHDACYGTCGRSKDWCDVLFLFRSGGNLVYFLAVQEFGSFPYYQAQVRACRSCTGRSK